MTTFKKLLLPTAVLLFTSMIFISCSETEPDTSSSEPYIIDLTAMDYAFAMPSEIKSGWVTFRFNNIGEEVHYGLIHKMKKNVSLDSLNRLKQQLSPQELRGYYQGKLGGPEYFIGGPGYQEGGTVSEVTLYMEPGTYYMLCAASTPDRTPHMFLGMDKFFKVTDTPSSAPEPEADITFTLRPYHVSYDGTLKAGMQTYKINHGGGVFDYHIFALNDTSTVTAARNFMGGLNNPTQALFLGGVEQAWSLEDRSRTFTSYLSVDLSPGRYMIMSQEYRHLGMYTSFEIPNNGSVDLDNHDFIKKEGQVAEISIRDQKIFAPDELQAGKITIKADESARGEHRVTFFPIPEGATIDEVVPYYQARQDPAMERYPLKHRKGNRVYIDENVDFQTTFNLDPGSYGVICLHDREYKDYSHLLNGEYTSFEVK